jgi:hypothetical protein
MSARSLLRLLTAREAACRALFRSAPPYALPLLQQTAFSVSGTAARHASGLSANLKAWQERASKELKGKEPLETLTWHTADVRTASCQALLQGHTPAGATWSSKLAHGTSCCCAGHRCQASVHARGHAAAGACHRRGEHTFISSSAVYAALTPPSPAAPAGTVLCIAPPSTAPAAMCLVSRTRWDCSCCWRHSSTEHAIPLGSSNSTDA